MSSTKPLTPPAEQVVAAAREWVGVPYRHQSSDRTRGIDCVQLVLAVGRQVGASVGIALSAYRPLTHPQHIRRQLTEHLTPIDIATPGAVVFWGVRPGVPTHLGILTDLRGELGVVHADPQRGKVVEHAIPHEQRALLDSFWWFA